MWRAGVVWVALALAAPCGAASDELAVAGGCREGVPNGAYQVRTSSGQLRVSGAFREGRRTGTFLFWNATGARVAVIPYDEDLRNGTIALWHVAERSGRPLGRRSEARFVAGALHGTRRAWHANGRQRSEAEYDHGRFVSGTAWDAQGRTRGSAAAQAELEREIEADEAYLESLERFVAKNTPRCSGL